MKRLNNKICENCHYSRPIDNEMAVACHRYPPTITKVEGNTMTSNFPLVTKTSWCGEFKLKISSKSK